MCVGGWGFPLGCFPPCGVSPRGVWGLPPPVLLSRVVATFHSDVCCLLWRIGAWPTSRPTTGLEGVDAAECGAAFFLGGGGPFLVGGGVSGVSRVGGVVVFVRGVDVVGLRNLRVAARDGGGVRAVV